MGTETHSDLDTAQRILEEAQSESAARAKEVRALGRELDTVTREVGCDSQTFKLFLRLVDVLSLETTKKETHTIVTTGNKTTRCNAGVRRKAGRP